MYSTIDCAVRDSVFTSCANGIFSLASSVTCYENITAEDCESGVSPLYSSNQTIRDSSFVNNTVAGAAIGYCVNTSLTGDTFDGCGVKLDGYKADHYLFEHSGSTVNGKPIALYESIVEWEWIDGDLYGQVFVANSSNCTVQGGDFHDVPTAVLTFESNNITVRGLNAWDVATVVGAYESTTINIIESRALNVDVAIEAKAVTDVYIENNDFRGCSSYGVDTFKVIGLTAIGNIIEASECSLSLRSSSDTTILDNTLLYGGVVISSSSPEESITDLDNTTVNGYPIVFFNGLHDYVLPAGDYGEVILVACTNVTLRDASFTNVSHGVFAVSSDQCSVESTEFSSVGYGVYLDHTNLVTAADCDFDSGICAIRSYIGDDLVVSGNHIVLSQQDGISASSTDSVTIDGNVICGADHDAIALSHGQTATIRNNIVCGSTRIGVYLYSEDGCVAFNNSVCGSTLSNAGDFEGTNSWNETMSGNRWDDYDEM